MGFAYKRGKVWYIGFKDAYGVQQREQCAAKTKAEAQDLAREQEKLSERIRRGLEIELRPLRFREVVADYFLAASAMRSYETMKARVTQHLLPHFGETMAAQITAADFNTFFALKETGKWKLPKGQIPAPPPKEGREGGFGRGRRKAGPLSAQTVNHLRNHASAILEHGRLMRAVKENVVLASTAPEVLEKDPKFLEPRFVPKLIAAVGDRWRNLFATAVYTGLRKGELLGLRVEDVHLERQLLHVCHSYDQPTKSGKERYVPIPDELIPFLRAQLAKCKSVYLFPSLEGGAQNRDADLADRFKRALKQADLLQGYDNVCRRCKKDGRSVVVGPRSAEPVQGACDTCGFKLWPKKVPLALSFKDLRSTYGTFSYEATGDIRFTKDSLGHYDSKVTERRYAKLRASRMVEQANKLKFGAKTDESMPTHNGLTSGNSEAPAPETRGAQSPAGTGENDNEGCGARTRDLRRDRPAPHRHGAIQSATDLDRTVASVRPSATERAQASLSATPQLTTDSQATGSRLLTVREVAELLRVHPSTVYDLAKREPKLGAVYIGAAVRIPSDRLAAFLKGGTP